MQFDVTFKKLNCRNAADEAFTSLTTLNTPGFWVKQLLCHLRLE
jgi:hypothetical protein